MEVKIKTQRQQILSHLINGKSLTPIDALNLFGCFRLSARIFEIRGQGFEVETSIVEKKGSKIAEYSLKK